MTLDALITNCTLSVHWMEYILWRTFYCWLIFSFLCSKSSKKQSPQMNNFDSEFPVRQTPCVFSFRYIDRIVATVCIYFRYWTVCSVQYFDDCVLSITVVVHYGTVWQQATLSRERFAKCPIFELCLQNIQMIRCVNCRFFHHYHHFTPRLSIGGYCLEFYQKVGSSSISMTAIHHFFSILSPKQNGKYKKVRLKAVIKA